MNNLYFFLLGLLAGWLIKTPFFFAYYRRIKRDKAHMQRLIDSSAYNLADRPCYHVRDSSRSIIDGVEHYRCIKCKQWIAL